MLGKKRWEYLQKLVHALSEADLKVLHIYLTAFDTNFDDEHRVKTLNLLDLVLTNPDLSMPEAVEILYGDPGRLKAFKYLVVRLVNKIHESFLINISKEREKSYSSRFRMLQDAFQRMMIKEHLLRRGIEDDILNQVNQGLRKAEKISFYPMQLEFLDFQMNFIGVRKGGKEYEKYYQIFEDRLQEYVLAEKVSSFVSRIKFYSDTTSESNKKELEILEHEVRPYLPLKAKESTPIRTRYSLYMLEVAFANMRFEYRESVRLLKEILDEAKVHSELGNSVIASILGNLANTEIFIKDLEHSMLHAREARNYVAETSLNYPVMLELEFQAAFYLRKYDLSGELIREINNEQWMGRSSTKSEKWQYFYAAQLFIEEDYTASMRILQQVHHLLKDQEGWNIGLRILYIMLLIETDELRGIDLAIDALRKHIAKLRQANLITQRYEIIYKVLNILNRQSNNFNKTLDKSARHFDKLLSDDPEFSWQINAHELIRFEDWFAAHLRVNDAKTMDFVSRIKDPALENE